MQEQHNPDVTCQRCGKVEHRPDANPPQTARLPDGWEGTTRKAVCPGCQFAAWHPHCTSLITWEEGERVDPDVDWAEMPREEWDFDSLTWCDYIDLTVSWVEDADWPQEWTCPKCGGTEFEGVHRDYQPSGLQAGGFSAEIDWTTTDSRVGRAEDPPTLPRPCKCKTDGMAAADPLPRSPRPRNLGSSRIRRPRSWIRNASPDKLASLGQLTGRGS